MREGGLETEQRGVLAEDQVGERMERPARDLFAARIEQHGGAAEHLLGRAAREGEQQDRFRLHAQLDEIGNAVGDRAGLAGARARDDEVRTVHGGGGLVLRRVEPFR